MSDRNNSGATDRSDRFVTVGEHEIHYSEWGSNNEPVVLCVHGFSRPGRDFDVLAAGLADEFHVLSPDLLGRGLSEWSDDPTADYPTDGSSKIMADFCDVLDINSLRWIGTSMGGSLGIYAGANHLQDKMEQLVVNDSGPGQLEGEPIDEEGIDRIVSYLSSPPAFERFSDLMSYYQDTYEPFSEMSDEEWRRFTTTSARRTDDGLFSPNYDTQAVEPYFSDSDRTRLWDEWDRLDATTLVLRGEDSDVLSQEVADTMQSRGPDSSLIEIEGCGHAPSLNVPSQIRPIREFLRS